MSQSDFEIDPDALDRECLAHPTLVFKYHSELADAKLMLEAAKTDLEEFKSLLERKIRDNPGKYDIVKLTEGAVAAYIKGDKRVQERAAKVKEMQSTLDMAWAGVHAITAKQQALSDLVRLHGQGYFDTPRLTEKGVESINKSARKKGTKAGKE